MAHTREELENMKRDELQKLAREIMPAGTRTRVVMMPKEELVSLLLGETKPDAAHVPNFVGGGTADAAALGTALLAALAGGLTPESVNAMIDEKIKEYKPKPNTIVIDKRAEPETRTDAGRQHFAFDAVLKAVSCGVNLYLWGPSGTGKTFLAESAMKSIGMAVEILPVFGQLSKADLLGYKDATGNYHASPLYRFATTSPAGLILDELDAGNANTLLALNSMLRNRFLNFPTGRADLPKENIIVGIGNTNMSGANLDFTARTRTDSATQKRFAYLYIDYDKELEKFLAGDAQDWVTYCHELRDKARTLKESLTITTDDVVSGARLIAGGHKIKDAADMLIWKGNEDQRKRMVSL
jgi:MoxR-like ATPase